MVTKKSTDPSPESIARANRQRLAKDEGARAMIDVAQKDVAVRKNMERLRALRQAKEAQEQAEEAAAPAEHRPKKRSKVASK
jgi:hypothetical protein